MRGYRRYQQARDLAWKVLLQLQVKRLPVDMRAAARQLGVEVLDMPRHDGISPVSRLLEKLGDAPCRSLQIKGTWHIFIKPGMLDDQRTHFAIAHELGHILLRHDTCSLEPGVRAPLSRDNPGDLQLEWENEWDYEADIFAVRLLAPACVLHALGASTASWLTSLAGLPPQASRIRAERMGLLNQRNAYFSHPLERQVYEQFLPFIQEQLAPAEEEESCAAFRTKMVLEAAIPKPPVSSERKEKRKIPVLWYLLLAGIIGIFILFVLIRG